MGALKADPEHHLGEFASDPAAIARQLRGFETEVASAVLSRTLSDPLPPSWPVGVTVNAFVEGDAPEIQAEGDGYLDCLGIVSAARRRGTHDQSSRRCTGSSCTRGAQPCT